MCVSEWAVVGEDEPNNCLVLQHKRLVPLLIGSISALAADVQELGNNATKNRRDVTSGIASKRYNPAVACEIHFAHSECVRSQLVPQQL